MTANDLNHYLAAIASDVSKGLPHLACLGHGAGKPDGAERRRVLIAAAEEISTFLASTPAVVRKSYVHATVPKLSEGAEAAALQQAARLYQGGGLLHGFLARREPRPE